jgi:hypothetical protein
MKEIDSIQTLIELSEEFQRMKRLIDPTSGLPDLLEEDLNWGDRFMRLIQEFELDPKRSLKGAD